MRKPSAIVAPTTAQRSRPIETDSQGAGNSEAAAFEPVFGRYFSDPEIEAAYHHAKHCVGITFALSANLSGRLIPLPESGYDMSLPVLAHSQILKLYRHIKALLKMLQPERGSDLYRDFAVHGQIVPPSALPPHLNRCMSAHAAALDVGQWFLDMVWGVTEGGGSIACNFQSWHLPSDESDLKIKEFDDKFTAVVSAFTTRFCSWDSYWDSGMHSALLEKEAFVTGIARTKERTVTTPPSHHTEPIDAKKHEPGLPELAGDDELRKLINKTGGGKTRSLLMYLFADGECPQRQIRDAMKHAGYSLASACDKVAFSKLVSPQSKRLLKKACCGPSDPQGKQSRW